MKRKLKKEIKFILILVGIFTLILTNINKISTDEIGNTCYGSIIKVCGGE